MNVNPSAVQAWPTAVDEGPVRRLAAAARDWLPVLAWLAAPALVWLASAPLTARFVTPSVALDSLAIVVGLVGYAAFATNLILGARLPLNEALFGDLGRAYRVHRSLGYGVPVLLVGHGLLMAASRAVFSVQAALTLFSPAAGWGIFLGVVALVALVAALFSPLVVRLPHETFVRLHRAVGLGFGVAALHVFLVPSASAMAPTLKAALLALAAAGAGAWLYRSALGRVLVRRFRYRVEAVNHLSASAVEIVLTAAGARLRHRPGQFALITVTNGSLPREAHPFSITSAPGEGRLRFTVKALGDFTRRLQGLRPGATVEVEGPFGRFDQLAAPNPRQVWIAGGIGVTPFLSMARALDSADHDANDHATDDAREIDLYYCTDRADDEYFVDELYAIADRNPRFRVIPIRKTDLGHITADDVRGASPVLGDKDLFMCGPPAMQRNLTRQFRALGVPSERIHYEDFGALAP